MVVLDGVVNGCYVELHDELSFVVGTKSGISMRIYPIGTRTTPRLKRRYIDLSRLA